VQSTRLAESFEPFTESVVLTGPEKFLRKAMCDPAVFLQTAWINPGAKVLMCLGMKNICGNPCCKRISMKKLSRCHFNDIYRHQSAPSAFKQMTSIDMNAHQKG